MPLEEGLADFSMKLIEIKGKTWKGIGNIHINLLISYGVFISMENIALEPYRAC